VSLFILCKTNDMKKVLLSFFVLSAFVVTFAAYAWSEPTANLPGANVPAPINTGPAAQFKSGPLSIGGVLQGSSVRAEQQLCIAGVCRNTWPAEGGGGGNWILSHHSTHGQNITMSLGVRRFCAMSSMSLVTWGQARWNQCRVVRHANGNWTLSGTGVTNAWGDTPPTCEAYCITFSESEEQIARAEMERDRLERERLAREELERQRLEWERQRQEEQQYWDPGLHY
jgi:hypothetical protein